MAIQHIPIDVEEKRFLKHLEIQDNDQIIFSGIFGIGKSYFIKHFFEKHSDRFIGIKLNPVNYAVSQNEDILEYLKYDVAFEILRYNPEFEKLKFKKNLFRQVYFYENYQKVIGSLIEGASKINQGFAGILESVKKLESHIQEAQGKIEIDEEKSIHEYLKSFFETKGSIFEENHITHLINGLVASVKQLNPDKELVLIIDDLDRIDPEHIFRILNVFSAHVNYHGSGEHKLGFDKVILISDISNIRNIFHSRYGSNTDFTGYIDKFYSTEVFDYKFKRVITKYIHDLFGTIQISSFDSNRSIGPESYLTVILKDIIADFFRSGALSMRSFINFASQPFEPEDLIFHSIDNRQILNTETPALLMFDILEKACGGSFQLKKAIQKTSEQNPFLKVNTFNTNWDRKYGDLVLLLDFQKNEFGHGRDYIYRNEKLNVAVRYNIELYNPSVICKATGIGAANVEFNMNVTEPTNPGDVILKKKVPYYGLLLDAYQMRLTLID